MKSPSDVEQVGVSTVQQLEGDVGVFAHVGVSHHHRAHLAVLRLVLGVVEHQGVVAELGRIVVQVCKICISLRILI